MDKTTVYFHMPTAPGNGKWKSWYIIISNIHNMHGQNKQSNATNQSINKLLVISLGHIFSIMFMNARCIQDKCSMQYEWYHITPSCSACK